MLHEPLGLTDAPAEVVVRDAEAESAVDRYHRHVAVCTAGAAERLDRRRKGSGCALTETRLVVQGPWEAARGEEQRDERAHSSSMDLSPSGALLSVRHPKTYPTEYLLHF